MIQYRTQLVIIIFIIISLLAIIHMIRKNALQLRYSLVWLFVGVSFLIIVLFPSVLRHLANLMGIYSIMNMLFFIGILFLIVIIYTLTIALSNMSKRIKDITQELAILKKEVNDNIIK